MNWDLLAVAFATAATLAFFRRRDGWAGVLIGLGAAAKFYPALLLVPFAANGCRTRAGSRRPAPVVVGRATWIAVNLPVRDRRARAWWEFFRFNGARGADFDSLWYLACRHLDARASRRNVNLLRSIVLLVAAFSWV